MSVQRVVAGFIPLLDCAVAVAAAECGFAAQEGIDLRLVRETSWANIRDRLIVGQLDVAHMLGPMAVAASLGAGHLRVPMVAGAALGSGGNAICVSTGLYAEMHDGALPGTLEASYQGGALRRAITARTARGAAAPVIATVYPFSCHTLQTRYWLAACGIDPDRDVQLVVLPPPLLVDALRAGQIDGFCVGAPWSGVAVSAGVGCVVTTAAHIWARPPEKVLGMRRDWAEAHEDTVIALLRAVLRAAEWCDDAGNHVELARLLSGPRYVGVPADLLLAGLSGQLRLTPAGGIAELRDFLRFDHPSLWPRARHAVWYYRQLQRWGLCAPVAGGEEAACAAFDDDRCARAFASLHWPLQPPVREERLFDGQPF